MAALELIRRNGVDALIMRDLAEVLGVSPMAAYYYVESKDDLIRLVANHVWSKVEIPSADAGPWYDRLRAGVIAERETVKQYRGLYDAALYLDVEQKRRVEDETLDVFLDAGYPPSTALPAFRYLMSSVSGSSSIEVGMRDRQRRRPPSHKSKATTIELDPESSPMLDADDYFRFGLDTLIAGLRVQLDA